MSLDIWNNGEIAHTELTNSCNNFNSNSSKFCKDKQIKGGPSGTNINYYNYDRKPYPPPSPDHYAVIEKPGINRWVMRGCFTSNNGNLKCDDFKGTFCSYDSNKDICLNNAPGGLADFTHPMNVLESSGNKGKYIRNGFILDKCECDLDLDELSDTSFQLSSSGTTTPSNYTCWRNKRNRFLDLTPFDWGISKDVSCCDTDSNRICMREGYRINNTKQGYNGPEADKCSNILFPGSKWTKYQSSEIWDGTGTCSNWYNPSIEELTKDGNYSKADKNNCSQYLLKWAKSCKWCKDTVNKGFKTNDGLSNCEQPYNSCKTPNQCAGDCTETAGGLFDNTCTIRFEDDICNICKSDIWDYIPGGWEALADENHPKHEMAKFAYIPKVVKTNIDCLQPEVYLSPPENNNIIKENEINKDKYNLKLTGLVGAAKFIDNKFTTTFTNLGPIMSKPIVGSNTEEVHSYDNNSSTKLFNSFCSDPNWVDNMNIKYDGTLVDDYNEENKSSLCDYNILNKSGKDNNSIGKDNNSNPTIWNGLPKNNKVYKLNKCNYDSNPKSQTICQRNPNLTGYGECDSEIDYYAKLWLQGKWDLSKYNGVTELYDEFAGESEDYKNEILNKRKIEALRCCLGLNSNNKSTNINSEEDKLLNCRPGFTCPSSNACKDLFKEILNNNDYYDFGSDYPENFSLNDDNIKPEWYLKAYCEMMSGGNKGKITENSPNCAHDLDSEILCRKAMHNYCSEPVTVETNNDIGLGITTKKIKYPLRVFTDECINWCNEDQNKLGDSLPTQAGTCDMSLGKTCQQLQVDGWIDPENWGNSKILKFADDKGNWIENNNINRIHKNLTEEKLKNACGCFLLGFQCNGQDCAVTYCGAGTDGNKGPGMVNMGSLDNYDYNNNIINTEYSLSEFNYNNKIAPKWKDNIDKDTFTCLGNKCFENCNYVNTNDTCWMASPLERPQDTPLEGPLEGPLDEIKEEFVNNIEEFRNIIKWECDESGSDCSPYSGYYSCFGECSIDSPNRDNCGTPGWFNDKNYLNPGEVKYKIRKDFIDNNPETSIKANDTRNVDNWPKWQNYYAYWNSIPNSFPSSDPNSEIKISGWGSYTSNENGLPQGINIPNNDFAVCGYPNCANSNSVKPYKYYKNPKNCGNTCSISSQISINNQGLLVGGIVSSLNSSDACNLIDSGWNTDALNSKQDNTKYIGLMGSNNCNDIMSTIGSQSCENCSINSTDETCNDCKKLLECTYGSNMCIQAKDITDSNGNIISYQGDNCQVCSGSKSKTCCLDPNLNSNVNWKKDNENLINIVGNSITYLCGDTINGCPNGTTEALCNNTSCKSITNEIECNECQYCTWTPENKEYGIDASCNPMCPVPVSGQWGVQVEVKETKMPTITIGPTTEPEVTGEVKENLNWGLVIGITFGVLVLLGIVFLLLINKKKKRF